MLTIEEYINLAELNERLGNDMELFSELADLFIEDSSRLLSLIKESIDSLDPETTRKYAHTIKGSIANFSAPRAYDAALLLENLGRNNDLTKADNAYGVLCDEVKKLKEVMGLIISRGKL